MLIPAALDPLFALSMPAAAQEMVPATLAGHAALPAFSFSVPPAHAPEEAWISGRFTAGTAPVNIPQSLEANGLMRPLFGQPIQGFSAYAFTRDPDGVILDVQETRLGEECLLPPDHPALRVPAGADYRVPRSRGFEGMAMTPEGAMVWAMLEGAILNAEGNSEDGVVRVLGYDPAAGDWTRESLLFRFTEGAVAIGDFNVSDDTRALVIERDGGQRHPSPACAEGETEGCFRRAARVKLIDTARIDAEGFVARLAQIDLMDIADPEGLARLPTDGDVPEGRFVFPFVTIESVIRDGEEHIIVGNDNNLPFSAGRQLGVADANEMIRLHVPGLLAAR